MPHIDVEITEEEQQVVAETLQSCIAELGMEIADTDRQAFRDGLKIRRQALIKALHLLAPERRVRQSVAE